MARGVVCESAGVYDNNGAVLGILASGAAAGGDLGGTFPNPTLAAIGAATGPIGDTTHTPVVTIDTKGRVTALTSAAIAFPADAVSSVFTRTGAVVAAANDYTLNQIGNATGDYSLNSHKITSLANGASAQDAAAFGQIPTALPPNGSAGGGLGGTYPNPSVTADGTSISNSGSTLAVIPAIVGGVVWTTVTKSGDEDRTNSTLAADASLFFTATSGGVYEIECFAVYASPVGAGTPDVKFAFGEDNTVRGNFLNLGWTTTDGNQLGSQPARNGASQSLGTAATKRAAQFLGSYTGAGGTFQVLWAQNTTGANPTTVYAGSLLRYRRIV